MIEYHTGSLFDVQSGYLGHACNCRGVWGSGIAVDFKRLFPEAFLAYSNRCQEFGRHLAGSAFIAGRVVCLFTSDGYGANVDTPAKIVEQTAWAVEQLEKAGLTEINIPKINSGRFNVPWELTEKVLKNSTITFRVWSVA